MTSRIASSSTTETGISSVEEEADIAVYLTTTPGGLMDRLLDQPSTCVAVLRLTSSPAQMIVMRLLYLPRAFTKTGVPIATVNAWFSTSSTSASKLDPSPPHRSSLGLAEGDLLSVNRNPSPKQLFKNRAWEVACNNPVVLSALDELTAFRLIQSPTLSADGHWCIRLHQVFQTSLQHWLLHGLEQGSDKDSSPFAVSDEGTVVHHVSAHELDLHATSTWNSALQHLVSGVQSDSSSYPRGVMALMEVASLMTRDNGGEDGAQTITSKGFQFLLQDMKTQIWTLILQYLKMAQRLNMSLVEVLHFLFRLGTLEPGCPCSVAKLTPTQSGMLEDLAGFGILFVRKGWFYPTKLASCLTSGRKASWARFEVEEDLQGYILIETNFRVYAYTNSPLKIAILGLFVDLQTRFPNMVTGVINRHSIRRGLAKGISAKQLLDYLNSHAHPAMQETTTTQRAAGPILPVTIVDQILLWEAEKNRLSMRDGFLYQGFLTRDEFDRVLEYGQGFGWIGWFDAASMQLMVQGAEGHEQCKSFLKRMNNPTA